MTNKILISVKRLEHSSDLPLPEIHTNLSAGVDLLAAINSFVVLKPHERKIRPRSGLAIKNGITVLNSPGTIDADYRGEIGVILINLSEINFKIERGMRIAQMVISPVTGITWEEMDILPQTSRGASGFGSTGTE